MQISATTFWLQKQGHAPAEYEDAYWPAAALIAADEFRCAVADGATEASFSQQWAQLLARSYWNGALRHEAMLPDLARLQTRWQQSFVAETAKKPLPWYATEKARLGAFASLLGLTMRDADPATADAAPTWDAIAVGDSDLCLVRDDDIVAAFPLTTAAEFGNGPFLISSNVGTAGTELERHLMTAHGELRDGDRFYLMTDALACWFLGSRDRGERPWERFDELPATVEASAEFALLVEHLRAEGLLHNDDVTLVRVHVALA